MQNITIKVVVVERVVKAVKRVVKAKARKTRRVMPITDQLLIDYKTECISV